MKKWILLLALNLSLSLLLAAKGPTQSDIDFGLGLGVGECFTAKCEIFRGIFLTDKPKPGQTIRIQVTEWMLGRDSDTELGVVEFPLDEPSKAAPKDGSPLFDAWAAGKILHNSPVTIVLPLEHMGFRQRGEPSKVVTDQHDSALIASLSAEALRLQRSPLYISALTSSLAQGPSPGLAGFLLLTLAHSPLIPDADTRCHLLGQLIQSASVSPVDWATVVTMMTSYYSKQSPSGRAATIDRLVRLSVDKDSLTAFVGIRGLAQVAQTEPSLETLVPLSTRPQLSQRYFDLLREKRFLPNSALETSLGISHGAAKSDK